jgi:hypothetical protein
MIKIPSPKTALIIFVSTVLVFYGAGCGMIYSSVAAFTQEAQEVYGGEPVPALIALLEDENASYENKNNAVWALGQIGDKRALPVLNELFTGEVQERPYDATAYIIQHTVRKAVRQINGFTLTRWMYRWLD